MKKKALNKSKTTSEMSYLPHFVLAVILVIGITIISSLTLYLIAVKNSVNCRPVNQSTVKEITERKIKEIEPAEETKNWEIYRNEEYNFEIKYPSALSPKPENIKNAGSKDVQQRINFSVDEKTKITILVWNVEATQDYNPKEKEKFKQLVIDKKSALQTEKKKQSNEVKDIYFLKTYIYSEQYVCQINYNGTDSEENLDLYDNMVSTLRFVK